MTEFEYDKESADRIEEIINSHPICLKDCADILEIVAPLCDLYSAKWAKNRIEKFIIEMTVLSNSNTTTKRVKGMWLYRKLLNSKYPWLKLRTSAERDSKGIIRYKVFGITVAKDSILGGNKMSKHIERDAVLLKGTNGLSPEQILSVLDCINSFVKGVPGGDAHWYDPRGGEHCADVGFGEEFWDQIYDYLKQELIND